MVSMPEITDPLTPLDERSDWVRLRTLLLLRWLAVGGQTLAVVVASR